VNTVFRGRMSTIVDAGLVVQHDKITHGGKA
jgi:hypothetical protein